MANLIGGSLSDIEQLATATRDAGEQTGAVYEEVRSRTAGFTTDIQEMTQRLRGDFEAFTGQVDAEATRLESVAEATNWQGRSGEAKRARHAELRARVTQFEHRAMEDVQSFRAALTDLVERHYDHIGTQMRTTIEAMQETHRAEAMHATNYASAARELDESAALG